MTEGSAGGSSNSMTMLLLTVSISYIILTLPGCLHIVIHPDDFNVDETLYYVGVFTQNLNHYINFYLYLLNGSRFRKELKSLFGFK